MSQPNDTCAAPRLDELFPNAPSINLELDFTLPEEMRNSYNYTAILRFAVRTSVGGENLPTPEELAGYINSSPDPPLWEGSNLVRAIENILDWLAQFDPQRHSFLEYQVSTTLWDKALHDLVHQGEQNLRRNVLFDSAGGVPPGLGIGVWQGVVPAAQHRQRGQPMVLATRKRLILARLGMGADDDPDEKDQAGAQQDEDDEEVTQDEHQHTATQHASPSSPTPAHELRAERDEIRAQRDESRAEQDELQAELAKVRADRDRLQAKTSWLETEVKDCTFLLTSDAARERRQQTQADLDRKAAELETRAAEAHELEESLRRRSSRLDLISDNLTAHEQYVGAQLQAQKNEFRDRVVRILRAVRGMHQIEMEEYRRQIGEWYAKRRVGRQ
ncbi:hypothetical protein EJ03DRAFT_355370 [Teratosphaeria nubilosa]|uniref:Uncharacterized protein n=1 Tax=Teratosphaeria nubilosa TaxID=161662 RepID=A0A6G1KXH7_9PEZI|nr:hypothetical protein EJ03DRAFT_355370 [Teratosphaeria nubilosa]